MTDAERFNPETPDIPGDRLEGLRELIPEAFTEGRLHWDRLREAPGEFEDASPERYSFSRAGKRDAIQILQTPSRAESVDFDTTQNIFIEGDNLEVLKLLYKSYFGRVKMIYIDPPYYTGNDFIYPDTRQSLLLCLAEKLVLEQARALNLEQETLFICRDSALNDETAANLALQCRLKVV